MPRTKRKCPGGFVYHVLNRSNGRLKIFKRPEDFAAFERILAEGIERFSIRLTGYCLMSNHWHLLLRPRRDDELSAFMQWITLTHSQRWHTSHRTVGMGHLYQGRFKSFPVQSGSHYLTVLRYMEQNPLRAGMVKRSVDWPWSSLAVRTGADKEGLRISAGPVALPGKWDKLVDLLPNETDLRKLEVCMSRGRPFGNEDWVANAVKEMDLGSTLRPRGRPKKTDDAKKCT
jgi:putative transposase